MILTLQICIKVTQMRCYVCEKCQFWNPFSVLNFWSSKKVAKSLLHGQKFFWASFLSSENTLQFTSSRFWKSWWLNAQDKRKLTAFTTTFMISANPGDFAHRASWWIIQWNLMVSCLLSIIFLAYFSKKKTNLSFEVTIAGALSVATNTCFLKSCCIFDTQSRKPF